MRETQQKGVRALCPSQDADVHNSMAISILCHQARISPARLYFTDVDSAACLRAASFSEEVASDSSSVQKAASMVRAGESDSITLPVLGSSVFHSHSSSIVMQQAVEGVVDLTTSVG
jgi:hypothetical protein